MSRVRMYSFIRPLLLQTGNHDTFCKLRGCNYII